jgi:diaminopimelate decarboxylase
MGKTCGNAGIFVTKVEFLKQNSEHSFAIVDGAMNDLLRPSFYNANIYSSRNKSCTVSRLRTS